jgi:hypothetical protein
MTTLFVSPRLTSPRLSGPIPIHPVDHPRLHLPARSDWSFPLHSPHRLPDPLQPLSLRLPDPPQPCSLHKE